MAINDKAIPSTSNVQTVVREVRGWVEPLGRVGFAAKGLIYVLVGGLAAQAAAGLGGETTGSEGALRRILQFPFGRFLLGAIALGLVGYGVWRLIQGYTDTENKGNKPKGLAVRAGYFVSGLIHFGLAASAASLARNSQQASGQKSTQDWAAWLLSLERGQWVVGAVGAVVLGVGVFQFYQAYSVRFRKHLKSGEMSRAEETWAVRIGRVGFAARGVVLCITGALVILAAIRIDPGDASGLEGSLRVLERQTYAPWLFGLVASGLVAYGLFQFVLARYRRMVIR